MSRYPLLLATAFALLPLILTHAASAAVTLREVDEVIPTYHAGPADPNPMFHFGRQSQGAEGRIYPYPLYDNLTNVRGEKTYRLVYLENEYVKIGILPEIGGRLFSAVDKTNNYDFVYRQHVIKPALIGLIGAWISGGIEWNIPHHHRASTFLPVQWRAEEHADGSKTVWVGELEVRHRMRWAVGYTLRPGSSVLECSLRIVNRTPLLQTMLCFANVAVNANDQYQIIFPPSTQWVTGHSKREFSSWPVSRGRYGGGDFSAGVDVSWYKNHVNATSMFAWNYQDDFWAGYDHGKQAGTMSVADHHIVPGKKFFTWGNGPRGRMWDDILTDTDGPYLELMVGAYSDNQPDYSWLQPFEARAFTMSWYPFRDIGGVKNANLAAAVNVEVKDGTISYGFNTTAAHPAAIARLTAAGKVLLEEKIAIDPAKPYVKKLALPAGVSAPQVRAALLVGDRELIAYAPLELAPQPQPAAVTAPPAPQDIKNEEELFLAGQRIDQFHDPRLDADPYWEELLRRDPGDVAANTGLGLLALRKARFDAAETHFRKAVERLTAKFTTPRNAEPLYYLGVALKAQGKTNEAIDAFYKAAWSQEWKAPAYFSLAEIAAARGDFNAALAFADQSLDANALNVRAYGLKAAALRHLGRANEARDVLALAARKTDPLDVRLMAERWLGAKADAAALFATLNDHPQTAQEIAAEFANAGLWSDGTAVLAQAVAAALVKTKVSPLVYYYLGDFAEKSGEPAKAAEYRRFAAAAWLDYVFPFQAELIPVLRRAMTADPRDARAAYYLGTLLFDWQPAEAVSLWEKAVAIEPGLAIAWRNLAQAYAREPGAQAQPKAIAALEKAVAVSHPHPTHLAELDQLYESTGAPVAKRLALLEPHRRAIAQKDEALASLIDLKTVAGQPDDAIALLKARTFSVWEGGTRYNTGESWTNAHLTRGMQHFRAKRFREALADFETAPKHPANLRTAERLGGPARQPEIAYWTGLAHEALGDSAKARAAFGEAAQEPAAPAVGRRGGRGGGNPLAVRASRYYQALALRKLGETARAETILRELVSSAATALAPDAEAAVDPNNSNFTNRDTARTRTATAHYIAGLGHAGLGEKEKAREQFTATLATVPDHLGAKLALEQL